LPDSNEDTQLSESFDEREMDKIIRLIVDRVRVNYFQNGEGRGSPAEVKRIIETNIDRV
jgi:hypothetical protein